MLIRMPDYMTFVSLSRRYVSVHGWQRNMTPVSVLVEEIPLSLVEACDRWVQRNQGVLEVYPSKLGDVSQRDVLLLAPLKAFMEKTVEDEEVAGLLSNIGGVLDRIPNRETVLTCGDKRLVVGRQPRVMGIINVTPDSFSDGGRHFRVEDAVARACQMVEDGADIIDVGGESSRPGSEPVGAHEEMERIVPVIRTLAKRIDVPISVDTTKAEVARAALDAGAGMINDISGLHWDLEVGKVAAEYKVPVIVMHTRGKPKTMQRDIHYRSLMSEIIRYLKEGVEIALASGVPSDQIVVDPGIGFGKTLENNLTIMNRLYELSVLGKPILLGASRKTFIGEILETDVDQRLEGTLATTAYGIIRGADIVRVHDVKENVRVVRMLERMMDLNEETVG